MEIKVNSETLEKIIVDFLPKLLSEKLSASYNNPIAVVIDEEIKGNTGNFRIFIKSLLASILTKPEFKEKIADLILAKIIKVGLKD